MKVEVSSLPNRELRDYDDKDVVEVRVDDSLIWQVYDDDPKLANLNHSFKDCRRVDALMRLAFDAGKRGEKFELIKEQVPGDLLWT